MDTAIDPACRAPRKFRHATHRAALAHMERLRKRGGSPDLWVYRCGDHWHVGHSTRSLRWRIREARRRWQDR